MWAREGVPENLRSACSTRKQVPPSRRQPRRPIAALLSLSAPHRAQIVLRSRLLHGAALGGAPPSPHGDACSTRTPPRQRSARELSSSPQKIPEVSSPLEWSSHQRHRAHRIAVFEPWSFILSCRDRFP